MFENPQVKVWDRISVVLFERPWTLFTDGATVYDNEWVLRVEFDDEQVHNFAKETSYVKKVPLENITKYWLID